MKLSIIIPTYNREQYISQAIESALSQTLADIEVIVVDDGSTDNTEKVITPYRNKINYIKTENGGVAHARNVGMKMAKGEYISWLDSDDIYYPYKSELQTDFLDKFSEIGMVYTEFSGFDDNGFFDEYHLKNYHSSAYQSGGVTYNDIFSEKFSIQDIFPHHKKWNNKTVYMGDIFDLYFQRIIVFTNSIMFRKDILDVVGLQNSEFGLFHDHEFVLRICKTFKAAFIDVPTYKLRYHNAQISESTNSDGSNVVIAKQESMLKIGEKFGVKDNEYYAENKDMVEKRMAILHKFLAVPLMTSGKEPVRARNHFEQCGYYGHPERLLQLITYFPHIARRICVKLLSKLKLL